MKWNTLLLSVMFLAISVSAFADEANKNKKVRCSALGEVLGYDCQERVHASDVEKEKEAIRSQAEQAAADEIARVQEQLRDEISDLKDLIAEKKTEEKQELQAKAEEQDGASLSKLRGQAAAKFMLNEYGELEVGGGMVDASCLTQEGLNNSRVRYLGFNNEKNRHEVQLHLSTVHCKKSNSGVYLSDVIMMLNGGTNRIPLENKSGPIALLHANKNADPNMSTSELYIADDLGITFETKEDREQREYEEEMQDRRKRIQAGLNEFTNQFSVACKNKNYDEAQKVLRDLQQAAQRVQGITNFSLDKQIEESLDDLAKIQANEAKAAVDKALADADSVGDVEDAIAMYRKEFGKTTKQLEDRVVEKLNLILEESKSHNQLVRNMSKSIIALKENFGKRGKLAKNKLIDSYARKGYSLAQRSIQSGAGEAVVTRYINSLKAQTETLQNREVKQLAGAQAGDYIGMLYGEIGNKQLEKGDLVAATRTVTKASKWINSKELAELQQDAIAKERKDAEKVANKELRKIAQASQECVKKAQMQVMPQAIVAMSAKCVEEHSKQMDKVAGAFREIVDAGADLSHAYGNTEKVENLEKYLAWHKAHFNQRNFTSSMAQSTGLTQMMHPYGYVQVQQQAFRNLQQAYYNRAMGGANGGQSMNGGYNLNQLNAGSNFNASDWL